MIRYIGDHVPVKWLRCDHSAIALYVPATYSAIGAGVGHVGTRASVHGRFSRRGIALAMASSEVRARVLEDFRDSPFPKHALELGSYLNGAKGGIVARDAARALGTSQPAFLKLVGALPSMGFKMERALDRVQWAGTANVVVYGAIKGGPFEHAFL
jgi:hypothetical protein